MSMLKPDCSQFSLHHQATISCTVTVYNLCFYPLLSHHDTFSSFLRCLQTERLKRKAFIKLRTLWSFAKFRWVSVCRIHSTARSPLPEVRYKNVGNFNTCYIFTNNKRFKILVSPIFFFSTRIPYSLYFQFLIFLLNDPTISFPLP